MGGPRTLQEALADIEAHARFVREKHHPGAVLREDGDLPFWVEPDDAGDDDEDEP